MRFPVKLCGSWLLLFTKSPAIDTRTKLSVDVDYEHVTYKSTWEFAGIAVEKQKTGKITKLDDKNGRIIWNKTRSIKLRTPIFPTISVPVIVDRITGQRFTYISEDESRWLTIISAGEEYTFRKTSTNCPGEDFPVFHKLLVTQLLLTEIINNLVDDIRHLHI